MSALVYRTVLIPNPALCSIIICFCVPRVPVLVFTYKLAIIRFRCCLSHYNTKPESKQQQHHKIICIFVWLITLLFDFAPNRSVDCLLQPPITFRFCENTRKLPAVPGVQKSFSDVKKPPSAIVMVRSGNCTRTRQGGLSKCHTIRHLTIIV